MIHAFDSKAAHGNRAYQLKMDRENLSFQVDAAIHVHTRRMRRYARDCLWYSVTCLVAATGVQTVAVHGWTWYSIPVVVIGVSSNSRNPILQSARCDMTLSRFCALSLRTLTNVVY